MKWFQLMFHHLPNCKILLHHQYLSQNRLVLLFLHLNRLHHLLFGQDRRLLLVLGLVVTFSGQPSN